jgi:hypothetical protein
MALNCTPSNLSYHVNLNANLDGSTNVFLTLQILFIMLDGNFVPLQQRI